MSPDRIIIEFDKALRTLTGLVKNHREVPQAPALAQEDLTLPERRHAAGLMRVNHVGEICAQALYQAQGLTSSSSTLKQQLMSAALEEEDHLGWCAHRLKELGSRPSLLNPVWYAGAFGLGLMAGVAGDQVSLGFVVETEKQVEKHLDGHLQSLPVNDFASRVIVDQMRLEEIAHAEMARNAGAHELPEFIKIAMQASSKLMTKTAYYI